MRRLKPEDWQLYRRIRLAALQEAPYAFGSTYAAEAGRPERSWRRTLDDRARFLAEVDGVVAGTASGGEGDSPAVAALTAMWVDPRFRRRGVGEVLVMAVMEWAKSNRYSKLLLWVTDGNNNAERLYERNGFARTGAQQDVRPGHLEYEMSREL
ncbi:MAG TPA: GNAT family N-acetyltransferase [Candidatus Dormibacteraeota bacterium]|nr:GNAT family N-acetyltransferase [Candidatus Dormibacteraeota bacterium]